MAQNDDIYLRELREHSAETRLLLSNPLKSERERMVVRAFLRCLGVAFADDEIVAGVEEPVDVQFRAARLQIREIVGDRRRGKEWVEREHRYLAAEAIAHVMTPFTESPRPWRRSPDATARRPAPRSTLWSMSTSEIRILA